MADKRLADIIESFVDEKILKENLEDIVGERFGRYSKYIIQDRALPDVRDGLKPVQRRILYSMHKQGMFSDKPYKKSARIVGDVIGKYHPHGDTSVYDAMVRLSQPWKIRNLLIDMHGNNGSIDGDSAAAMRYTEARMTHESEFLLRDIDKRTVDFIPNFDDEEYEPTVLPAKYPNILVNGASGISAGYATEIPPHNPREVINAVIKRLDDSLETVEDLVKVMRGPDFPTGGIVQGKDQILQAYETGRGRIVIRSVTEIQGESIIVTEIPYEVNKALLVRKIDDIRIKKQIDGIKEVRDESDREGLRIVIDVKSGFNPTSIENFLHKKTDLSKNYNYNMVAINNKRPQLMSVLEIIDAYILHQKEVITNRSNYELRKASKRLHIVEGIIRLMDVLDEVIALIRASKNKQDAKNQLMKKFKFSDEQSEAIVTLQLYKLSNTDITAMQEEKDSLEKIIERLKQIISNETELESVIKDELTEVMKKMHTKRISKVEEEIEKIVVQEEQLISEETLVVGVSCAGYIKASSPRSYRSTKQAQVRDNDSLLFESEVSSLNTLLLFTNTGNYVYIPIYKLPQFKWKDLGTHINNIVQLEQDEEIIKVILVEDFNVEQYLLFVTKDNLVKVTKLNEFEVSRFNKTIKAIKLNKGDEVVSIDTTSSLDKEVLLFADNGQGLRFPLSEIPVTATTAKGVKGMRLNPDQKLSAGVILENYNVLIILTNRGTIKRIDPVEIPKKRRTNKGYQVYKVVKSNPYLVKDVCLMNATQYKNKVTVRINTDLQLVEISAFDIKVDDTKNGKLFVKKGQGTALYINIEQVEEDPTNPPISEYVKEKDVEIVQQKLSI
jgi:topoisomerase-4 subunit A